MITDAIVQAAVLSIQGMQVLAAALMIWVAILAVWHSI